MSDYKVVEKNNYHAVHCYTWSYERGLEWIEKYGDSKMFDDKTLTKDSFEVVKKTNRKEQPLRRNYDARRKDDRCA